MRTVGEALDLQCSFIHYARKCNPPRGLDGASFNPRPRTEGDLFAEEEAARRKTEQPALFDF